MANLRCICLLALLIAALSARSGFSAECGELTIARMDWPSAELLAEVDKRILNEGYGCQAVLVSGDSVPTLQSMSDMGQPDLAPEIWINAIRDELQAAVERGSLVMAGEVLADGGEEGFWIPKFLADKHPEIKTVSDALARPDLFESSESEGRGAIHNCPAEWTCHVPTRNLYKALGAEDKGFELVDTGSSAGLDGSIARAYEQGRGWLGYYWSPTATLGRYEMVKLQLATHDVDEWSNCTTDPACDLPKINGWPRSEVYSVLTDAFAQNASAALACLDD